MCSDATCPQPARTDSSGCIQKKGSTLEPRGRVRVAGKPSDEPLRKGETQSPDEYPSDFHPVYLGSRCEWQFRSDNVLW